MAVAGGVVTLMAPGWWPPTAGISQAYAFCITDTAGLVLVDGGGGFWNLPGGTIEAGETPEQALVREVDEEACATIVSCEYIASQHVWDGRNSYFQSRWWARVRLDPWEPHHETVNRQVVDPNTFLDVLSWEEKTIAARLLGLALGIDGAP